MPFNQDFKDLFALFNQEAVEYLVVGAHTSGRKIGEWVVKE
jgi:hypothetical protein